MPLIYNGKIIAGDQRPVLTEVIEDSNYLVESKGIAEYVKNNFSNKIVDAISSDNGKTYQVNIPELLSLKNGLELTIIPNIPSSVKRAQIQINNFGFNEIRLSSSGTSGAAYIATKETYISGSSPLKIMYNMEKGYWITLNINRPVLSDISGYGALLERIEALEELVKNV